MRGQTIKDAFEIQWNSSSKSTSASDGDEAEEDAGMIDPLVGLRRVKYLGRRN